MREASNTRVERHLIQELASLRPSTCRYSRREYHAVSHEIYFLGVPDPSCKCAQSGLLFVHRKPRHTWSRQSQPVLWYILHRCCASACTNPLVALQRCDSLKAFVPLAVRLWTILVGCLQLGSLHSCECLAIGCLNVLVLLPKAHAFTPGTWPRLLPFAIMSLAVPAPCAQELCADFPPPEKLSLFYYHERWTELLCLCVCVCVRVWVEE